MNTILQDILEHHIWANDVLLGFCEGLRTAELALTVPGTFGTVEDIWVHVASNEEHYLRMLSGVGVTGEMRTAIFDGDLPRELASVRPVLAKTAGAWRALVRDWPHNVVMAFRGKATSSTCRSRCLWHRRSITPPSTERTFARFSPRMA